MNAVLRNVLLTCTIVGLVSSVAFAQGSAKSSLSGVVTDSAGGVIPGATVSVKNLANGLTTDVVTNTTGAFSVPALDATTYTVTVSLPGFRTAVVTDVRLVAGQPGSIQVKLEVGNLSETIQVRGGTELVQTQSAAVSSTISANQIQNLPLTTRNALLFVAMLPGVDQVGAVRDSTLFGLPEQTINITIDGVNTNNNMQRSSDGFYSMVFPQLDAVEQVTLTGATPGAESAGSGSVAIRFVTRSGTDQYKGTGYYYGRRPGLNTNYYFNKRDGLPKNEVILNQFGASAGGPIAIPGLFDGRGKAFFFVNYEEFYQPTEATRTRTIFNPDAQRGIFRYNVAAGGVTTVREVDLFALAAANGQITSTDPTVVALLAQIRTAALSSGVIRANNDPNTSSYVYLSGGKFQNHLPTTRVDFNLTQRHRLSGTYYWQEINRLPDIQNTDDAQFPGFPNTGNYLSYRTVGSATLRSTMTSNLVNELLTGWQWSPGKFSADVVPSMFGNQGGFDLTLPLVSSATTQNGPSQRNTVNWNIDDTVNWLKGSHGLTFGGAYTQIRHWETASSAVPQINFGVDATNDPANAMFNTTNLQGASNANLNDARALYALLTGRVTAINGTGRLDEQTNKYVYLGPSDQRALMNEIGVFAQDSWRVRPNLTLNYGLRWEVQLPIKTVNDVYATAGYADFCGIYGTGADGQCNLFKVGGPQTGTRPQFVQYEGNKPGYNTDWNNFAPNIGAAWRPEVQSGFLRRLLGDPEQATIRGGYSVAYNRAGMDEFTGIYSGNPGRTTSFNRTAANGNLVYAGETWPVLLRDRNRLGPPTQINGVAIPDSPVYPILATTANNLNIFDPDIEVPYTRSYSLGLQRSLSRDMVFEVRYVGTRGQKLWTTENWNEINVIENGFLNEFKLAQTNLRANIAAGRGNSFAYFGPGTGTAPLPIFVAHYNAVPAAQAGEAARYTGANWTNTTFVNFLAQYQPNLFGFASTNGTNGLYGNTTFRANGITAGLPTNFWLMNPDVGGASIRRSAASSRYDSFVIELRRRLSRGLLMSGSYTAAWKDTSALDTLHRERVMVQATGNTARIPHAFKVTANYEIPVGRGQRFAGNVNPWLNGIVGNWSYNMTGRVQSGRLLTATGVRLVGMTEKDLQKEYKIRINPTTGIVTILPQDIIDNTIKAYSTSATSADGYGGLGAPTGRYIAPASAPGCVEAYPGDCGEPRNIYVTGPMFTRFDMSLKKRVPLGGKMSFDFEVDVLNAFNAINFVPVFNPGSAATIFQIDSAYTDISGTYDPGGRLTQLVFRLNW